jgi:hypothetical protein
METPSEKLALLILDRLIESKVLLPSDRDKLQSKLAEGKLTRDDWRLAIELAMDKKEKK